MLYSVPSGENFLLMHCLRPEVNEGPNIAPYHVKNGHERELVCTPVFVCLLI